MLYRNQIRTVKVSTETTRETQTINSSALPFNLTTSEAFYVGYEKPFATRYFNLSVANTNSSDLTVTFWNGSDWASVEDLIDQTDGFTTSGFIGWQNPGSWQKKALSPITDVELYWVKIVTSANLSNTTALQSVNNLFCDSMLLRAYYPELVSDSRYLPTNRTDFLDQFEGAKDLVVLRLKQLKAIEDESEIIDINEVAVAAVHAAAYLILKPIARGDEARQMVKDAYDDFERELKLTTHSFDKDNSGVVSENEKNVNTTFIARF